MEEIKLQLDENRRGEFKLMVDGKEAGEMAIAVGDNRLTVFHTEVDPELEGKGYAKQLLATMVDYARKNHLKVAPICPFVHAQFKRHPEQYADLWKPGEV